MTELSDLVLIGEDFGSIYFRVQLPYKYDDDHAAAMTDEIRNHIIPVVGDEHWNADIEDTYISETDEGSFEFILEISTSNNKKQQLIYEKVVAAAKSFVPSEHVANALVKV